MWIFTLDGFFSVVKKASAQDPTRTLCVRARLSGDAQRFAGIAAKLEGGAHAVALPVEEGTGTDYPFRVYVHAKTWARYLAQASRDITYDNFKGALAMRYAPMTAGGAETPRMDLAKQIHHVAYAVGQYYRVRTQGSQRPGRSNRG